jgi:hypothetical protein
LVASTLIIISSSALFLYWFRYTCLLLIRQGSAEHAVKVTCIIRLSFHQTQETLHTAQPEVLDRLHESLERDYEILSDLLRHATGGISIERRILTIDYKLMKGWYAVTRTGRNLAQARKALSEMSSILSYFAEEIGLSAAA